MTRPDPRLLAALLEEFRLRDEGFLARCPVGLSDLPILAATLAGHPVFDGLDREAALADAFAWFVDNGLRAGEGDELPLATETLAAGALDALAAAAGRIALAPGPSPAVDLSRLLSTQYELRQAGEVRYLVRRGGRRWLLLVNAVGIPLSLWSRLLGDLDHDYRVLAVESACCDLAAGGMDRPSDVAADAARIGQALDAEGVEALHVLGWCSSGRTALEVAARQGDRVKSLVFSACSFRGVPGVEARPTPFERDVQGIVETVSRTPSAAGFLSRLLVQAPQAAQPPSDAVSLFRLAARSHSQAVLAPFADADRLVAYCARMKDDQAHPTAEALARVSAPILMLAGAHDQIIDNRVVWETLTRHAASVAGVVVRGAGHYVHDLQYPWFRLVLDAFTADGAPPPATARLARFDEPQPTAA